MTPNKENFECSLIVVAAIIICGIILFINGSCTKAFPDETKNDCQDPDKLPDDLKKAYYELKEAEKQIPGMKVSIRCYEKNSLDN